MTHGHEMEFQRRYYVDTAPHYDSMHFHEDDAQFFALSFLVSALDYLGVRSVLDVGSGTGRALRFIKKSRPNLRVAGIEPVRELREVGHAAGLSEQELRDGDGTSLDFEDSTFDLVCEFGVLHHVRNPQTVISEMLRVARSAIFISDSNNFGQGHAMARTLKQCINAVGLWRLADLVKTRGKGYTMSSGDGLAYSYSVFNNYADIRRSCKRVHIVNTSDGCINPYRTASHVALLGIKK